MFDLVAHPNFAVSGFIIANCIRRRVTSNGYENDWARAPAKPPHKSFAGIERTRPPKTRENRSIASGQFDWLRITTNLYFSPVYCTPYSASISCRQISAPQSSRTRDQHKEPFHIVSGQILYTAPELRPPPSVSTMPYEEFPCICARR